MNAISTLLALALSALFVVTDPLAASEMQATVEGQVLTSKGFPPGAIEFDSGLKYMSAERFVLYKVADCEIHLFAEVEGGRMRRLYWVLEGYLPNKKRLKYDYSDSERRTVIGGHEFYDDSWFTNIDAARKRWRAGSDIAHAFALSESNGVTAGPDLMGIRLVRLSDDRRKELMIIYYEDLESTGFTAVDLRKGGPAVDRGPEFLEGLRERALQGMTLTMD